MWFLYSISSAFAETVKDILSKKYLKNIDEYSLAAAFHVWTLLFSIPLLVRFGIPVLKTEFWIGSFLFLFITPTWTILYAKAIKGAELSKVLPIMALNPVMTALLTFVVGGDQLTFYDWAGILFICFGMYSMYIKVKDKNSLSLKSFFQPIQSIWESNGSKAMFGVALLWSIGAHVSKLRVDGSSPVFSTFTGGLIGVSTTWIIALYMRKKGLFQSFRTHYIGLFGVGLFYYLATLLSSIALSVGNAAFVFSVKRSSILFGSLYGFLRLKESFSLAKLIGLVFLTLGIVMLAML